MTAVQRFIRDERGTTPIEYGIIGTLISIMCIAGASAIGLNLKSKWLGPLAGALN
jgi:pilus assembly protein Flp/PilA